MPDRPVIAAAGPLVCGVDFSPESRRALLYSSALAARLGCRLHVVSAVEPLLAEAARLRNQLATFIDQVARDLREFAPLGLPADRVTYEASAGEPAPVVLAAATQIHARMIVVGTRGWGQAARLVLGSTTLRLLRTTTTAVLVTDWDATFDMPAAAARGAVSRIVCGVDFSDGSRAAVEAAAGLASDLGAGLTLVHAVPPARVPLGWDALVREVEADWIGEATKRLEDLARSLPKLPAGRVVVGSPTDVLAAEVGDDAQAIVAVGLRGLAHHRPGSTALRLVSLMKVPVLAVPQ
jgi:nucleotide-binding universal stress UspA family protein